MASATEKWWVAGGLCLCGAPLLAAEWSVTPGVAWELDHSTNRVLREDAPQSQAASATLDLALARRSEKGELILAPHARVRRFTDDVQPDADDFSLSGAFRREYERSELSFEARVADESTLTTELAETGVIRRDASRRTESASLGWNFAHAEARRFDASVSFEDVDYRGVRSGLFGYRYGAASVGETFVLGPRWSVTASAFASRLDSPQRDSRSEESGASLGAGFEFSEHTSISASLGASRRDIDGRDGSGSTRSLTLTHRGELSRWSLDYQHRLVPFGSGVLTERDSAELSYARDLDSRWRAAAHAGAVRNRDAGFGFTFDDRTYRYADSQLIWSATEHWTLAAVAGFASADDLSRAGSVQGWSLALRSTWAPAGRVLGH